MREMNEMAESARSFGVVCMENNYGGGGGRGGRDGLASSGSAEVDPVVLSSGPCFSGDWRGDACLGEREDSELSVPERLSQSSDGELVQDAGHLGVADAHCPSCGAEQDPRQFSQGQMMQVTRMNSQSEVFGSGTVGGGGERRRDKKRVALNVGGQICETSIETLSFDPRSMLAAMVTRHMPSKEDEILFIDRDPVRFRHVLNYLRSQTIWLDDLSDLRAVQEEADFFNLNGLYDICEEKIQEILHVKDEQLEVDVLKETLKVMMEELKGTIKMATGPENHKSNQNRKEPVSGVRRRRLDYETLNDTVFRMDEDF